MGILPTHTMNYVKWKFIVRFAFLIYLFFLIYSYVLSNIQETKKKKRLKEEKINILLGYKDIVIQLDI